MSAVSEHLTDLLPQRQQGILKEGKDLYKKWNNPRYGTNIEIIQDSLKDLKNNALGIAKGLSSSDINQCSEILPQNARKQLF